MTRHLGRQGVETPATLGKKPVQRQEAAPVSKSAEMIEQALADVQTIRQRLQESAVQAYRSTDAAQRLYHGVLVLTGQVRDTTPDGTELPPEVEDAMGLLLALAEYDTPPEVAHDVRCPACVDDRHDKCVVTVLTDDDDTTGLCACLTAGHPPLTVSDVACPECVQGKHPNCTLTVLGPDDEIVPCACQVTGHPL